MFNELKINNLIAITIVVMVSLFVIHIAILPKCKYDRTAAVLTNVNPIDGASSKQDLRTRMDLAIKQEFEMTKDPALGYVPTERLAEAYEYMKRKQSLTKNSQKGTTAISGITWTERGPTNQGGRTRAILVDLNDPTHKTVFAGGVGGGVWKTTDITVASPSWAIINDFLGNLAVTSIVQDPANPQIMYFSTGEGYGNGDAIRGLGIWKSIDGGTTWNHLANTSTLRYIQKLLISNGVLFAATWSGIRRSADGGTTWTTFSSGFYFYDLEKAADGSIYATRGGGSIYKSSDNGLTYSALSIAPITGNRIELAVAQSDPAYLYALVEKDNMVEAILKSTDAGATWISLSEPSWLDINATPNNSDFSRTQAWYDLTIEIDPNNRDMIFIGGVDLFKSTNGGSSWSQVSHWYGGFGFQYVHADQHIIYYEPGNSNVIYFGNDGGVFRSGNAIAAVPTISYRGNNYRTIQFYGCAIHPAAGSNHFLGGTQDNGSQRFSAAGLGTTVEVTSGDGAFCHIDKNEPQYQYTQYVHNNFRRSINSGASFSATGLNFGNSGRFINPSDYDDIENDMYAAHNDGNYFLIKNIHDMAQTTSSAITIAAFGTAQVSAVTCSEAVSGKVWFGLDNGGVVRVDNAASATPIATDLSAGLTAGYVSSIVVDPGNENHILVTRSSYGVISIYESSNGGATWGAVEGNLPDMPVRWAIFNPDNSDQVLIATELGVWSTDNLNGASTDWDPSNTGLANVRVDMLQYRPSDKMIIASTHGRGLFSTTIVVPTPVSLGDFQGEFINDDVKLAWYTYSEMNNEGFDIERSTDGIHFSKIAFVQGAGTTNVPQTYQYMDENLNGGHYYYRLKQIDQDGDYTYPDVVYVQNNKVDLFEIVTIFPNPATTEVTLVFSIPVSELDIEIYDGSGKKVLGSRKENSGLQHTILINSLNSGIYSIGCIYKGRKGFSKFRKI